MTLTVIIGKIGIPNNTDCSIEECPMESYDVCNPEYTQYPDRAFRSGSGMCDFFDLHVTAIYKEIMRLKERSVPIKPFIDRINALPDDLCDDSHNDRMKWLKFWCNRAVGLYGDKAVIEFC